jgi:hypothetical protein
MNIGVWIRRRAMGKYMPFNFFALFTTEADPVKFYPTIGCPDCMLFLEKWVSYSVSINNS